MSNLRALWESVGGSAPEYWEFKTIENLLEHSKSISVGVMYPGQDTEGGVPLVKVSNVKNGAISTEPEFCVSKEVDEEYKRTRLNGTELLLTLVGNPGDCVVVTEDMAGWNAARALAVIRLADIELRSWLRYVLLSKPAKHLIDTRLNTTVQKTLNLKDVRELGLPIPPKEEREGITKIIDAIELKSLVNNQTNQTLENIAQAIFKSWFVDFEPTRAKITAIQNGQDPERAAMAAISGKTIEALNQLSLSQQQSLQATAALFPDTLVDSELGEIPEGWETQKIEDIMELSYGKALKKTDRISGEFPVYGSGGLTGTHKEHLVKGPGIIVGRKGTVGALYWEDQSFFPIDTVFYVKCKEGMTLVYSYYLLQTLGLENMNTDAAVPGLNRKNAYRLEIPKAPAALIDIYSTFTQVLRGNMSVAQKETKTLIELRDSLLPKLLSGELNTNKKDAA